jgi:2-methylcitrate dehydratase PrpD
MSEQATNPTGITVRLAEFVSQLRFENLTEPVMTAAHMAWLDTIGVTIAGVDSDIGKIIANYASGHSSEGGCAIVGYGFRASPEFAALANGAMGHALDYDDATYGVMGHLSTVIVPALLALGELEKSSGRDLVTAYVAGFEVGSRLGKALNPKLVETGWHSTSVIGTLAATAACANLARLSLEQTQNAMGMATSQAAGTLAQMGTMTKPLHAGLAARDAVAAALLARAGVTACLTIMEVDRGFADLYGGAGKWTAEPFVAGLGSDWHLLTVPNVRKAYPCVMETHRAIDATFQLMREEKIQVDKISRVDVGVWYLGPSTLIYPDPKNPLEAKFSMQHSVAAAMLDGRVGLAQYTPERLADPQLRELMRKIQIYVHPEMADSSSWGTSVRFQQVTVTMNDGATFTRRVAAQKGHPANPMSTEELEAKFEECATLIFSHSQVIRLAEMLKNLSSVTDIRTLTNSLQSDRPVAA